VLIVTDADYGADTRKNSNGAESSPL
jgi:hypothetical protein